MNRIFFFIDVPIFMIFSSFFFICHAMMEELCLRQWETLTPISTKMSLKRIFCWKKKINSQNHFILVIYHCVVNIGFVFSWNVGINRFHLLYKSESQKNNPLSEKRKTKTDELKHVRWTVFSFSSSAHEDLMCLTILIDISI